MEERGQYAFCDISDAYKSGAGVHRKKQPAYPRTNTKGIYSMVKTEGILTKQ